MLWTSGPDIPPHSWTRPAALAEARLALVSAPEGLDLADGADVLTAAFAVLPFVREPLPAPAFGDEVTPAARAAFEVIRRELAKNGAPSVLRGPIVIATVKGDIHDIGKNIVRALLENYGFKVVDLGRDVAPEAVVEAAVRLDCRLVGLSALMTTTVGFMEETIRLLKAAKPDCRTVVGGAVLTAEYAAQIGATYYGKDAMATVRVAEEVFG